MVCVVSVVVDEFNVLWTFRGPDKANPELVVYADRMLFATVSLEGFEPIGTRRAQVIQHPARKIGIHPTLEADLGCLSSALGKNISILFRPKSPAFMALSRARKRGVSTVTKRWARGAMGASCHKTSDYCAHGEVVWS